MAADVRVLLGYKKICYFSTLPVVIMVTLDDNTSSQMMVFGNNIRMQQCTNIQK